MGEPATQVRPWDWRKASGGIWLGDDKRRADGSLHRVFHAYDVNDNAACEPIYGLAATREPPNEGSEFCGQCMVVVRELPAGREARLCVRCGEQVDVAGRDGHRRDHRLADLEERLAALEVAAREAGGRLSAIGTAA